MKIENIEDARLLIKERDTLQQILANNEIWKSGHFEFVEHCGFSPDKIKLLCFPELQGRMLYCIREEIIIIEKKLKEL